MKIRYTIREPEALCELARFVKTGSLTPAEKVWKADRAKHGGKSKLDGTVHVVFNTDGGMCSAYVGRSSSGDKQLIPLATLKYAPALAWCKAELSADGAMIL